jgi:hypothetical protein
MRVEHNPCLSIIYKVWEIRRVVPRNQKNPVHPLASGKYRHYITVAISLSDDCRTALFTNMASLNSLAATIVAESRKLADFIEANNLPTPSLAAGGPPTLPIPIDNAELKAAQLRLYTATQELSILTLGPAEHVRWQAWSVRIFPFLLILANAR